MPEVEAKKVETEIKPEVKTEGAVIEPVVVIDPITKLEEENAKLIEERDNYKNVALKRLGKLPGDADFLNGEGKDELTVEEQVKLILLQREIDANEKSKNEETKRILRENSELKLALKNRPGGSIGSEGGSVVDVKDNVFSAEQIAELTRKAVQLKADPAKFIEKAKQNLLAKR